MRDRDLPNPYAYGPERREWFSRFTLSPVAPADVEARLADGRALETTDLPSYLGTKAHTDAETGVCLYRLVQLWGTPNVPELTAGGVARERAQTTWQYLFEASYDRGDDDAEAVPDRFLLSVYDFRTDLSTGLSGFRSTDDGLGTVHEPSVAPVGPVEPLPPDAFLEGVVSLVLNMVDEPVPATYKELWI